MPVEFHNPDILQVLPIREYIREHFPQPTAGLVIEDLDLVPLVFGPLAGRNKSADGKFMLVEVKYPGWDIAYAQKRVFGLIDRLLRKADPDGEFYRGFHVINWDPHAQLPVCLNGQPCSEELFFDWITGAVDVEPYFG